MDSISGLREIRTNMNQELPTLLGNISSLSEIVLQNLDSVTTNHEQPTMLDNVMHCNIKKRLINFLIEENKQ
jgi:hypothetical protein